MDTCILFNGTNKETVLELSHRKRLLLSNPYIILNPNESYMKVGIGKIFNGITRNIFPTMAENKSEEILNTTPPSSTFPMRFGVPQSKESLPDGSSVAPNSKVIQKAGNKDKKYMGARRSCAWIHFRPNGSFFGEA